MPETALVSLRTLASFFLSFLPFLPSHSDTPQATRSTARRVSRECQSHVGCSRFSFRVHANAQRVFAPFLPRSPPLVPVTSSAVAETMSISSQDGCWSFEVAKQIDPAVLWVLWISASLCSWTRRPLRQAWPRQLMANSLHRCRTLLSCATSSTSQIRFSMSHGKRVSPWIAV